MAVEGFFKTAMGGFRKSDVLNFIDRQEKDFKEREKQLTAEAESLRAELGKVADEKAKLDARISELEARVREADAFEGMAKEKLTLLAGESENRKCAMNRAEAIIEDLRHEVAVLHQGAEEARMNVRLKDEKIAELNKTISSIDTTQQRITRVMVEAQNTADKISADARAEAAAILGKAAKKCAQLLAPVGAFKKDLETLLSRTDDFTAEIGEMEGDLEKGVSMFEKTGEMSEAPVEESAILETGMKTEPEPRVEETTQPQISEPAAPAAPAQKPAPKAPEEKPLEDRLFDFTRQGNRFHWDRNAD